MSRRPGFPARLDLSSGAPVAVKSVASGLGPVRAWGQNDNENQRPHGVGLDSGAVRARMVLKLAGQGISDAQVLSAMGAVERHRFVDSALVNQAYEDTS